MEQTAPYVEPGGSWRTFWVVGTVFAAVLALDAVVPGFRVPPAVSVGTVVAVLGVIAVGTLSSRRLWTLRVDGERLTVGRESVGLPDIDPAHLAGVDAGVDAGAPVFGGSWSIPKGRTGFPLRLADGRTVLVPTSDPAALRTALLAARGTLGR